jgi:hypothetical protein
VFNIHVSLLTHRRHKTFTLILMHIKPNYSTWHSYFPVSFHVEQFLFITVTYIFLIGIVGGWVQLGPLGTAATNTPILPAPGDYYNAGICGMMIGKGNRSNRRKPGPLPRCPPQTPHAYPDVNPGRRCGKAATNRLSYGTALLLY